MDFHNYLNDFVLAKQKLDSNLKAQELDKKAQVYNPFMEDSDE